MADLINGQSDMTVCGEADAAPMAFEMAGALQPNVLLTDLSYRDLSGRSALHLKPHELEKELVFVGLVGMQDPPRPEAKEAVAHCRRTGIRVVMITGDHPRTALAVARELGIANESGLVLSGTELDKLSTAEL